jgi:hypothetical protein
VPDKERRDLRRQLVPGKGAQNQRFHFVPGKEQQESKHKRGARIPEP